MTTQIDEITHEDAQDKLIKISKRNFKLTLLRRDQPQRGRPYKFYKIDEYKIAHGAEGFPTPSGYFVIMRKAKDPDWRPPDSDWVTAEMRDTNGVPKLIPGGDPNNPIRGAFLDIGDGYGIHGTMNLESIGTRASHGCVRVTEDEAYELYRRVPVGTIVHIF